MNDATYRFRVIAGPQSGKTFHVGEKGALLGRSENCDVIIVDPSLSRHHCRIFQRDGLLWVADLKSANSTAVDDRPVQEAPLWKDRRITIGDTVIIVEADTGIRHPSQPASLIRPNLPFVMIAAILAIAAIAFFLYFPRSPSRTTAHLAPSESSGSAPIAVATPNQFALDYYHIQTDTQTIRTTHFQILPPANASIRIEDLATKREMRRTVTMPRYQIELLITQLTDSGFFSLASLPPDSNPSAEIRISAILQDRQHTVRHSPQEGSASFRRVAAQIEDTAALLFGDWIKDFSDENLINLAMQQRTVAQAMAGPMEPQRHQHLYNAIEQLEYAAWLLQPIHPPPEIAAQINQTLYEYTLAFDAYVRDRFSEADRAASANNAAAETAALRLILSALPNEQDLRYRTAASRLMLLEQEGDIDHAP